MSASFTNDTIKTKAVKQVTGCQCCPVRLAAKTRDDACLDCATEASPAPPSYPNQEMQRLGTDRLPSPALAPNLCTLGGNGVVSRKWVLAHQLGDPETVPASWLWHPCQAHIWTVSGKQLSCLSLFLSSQINIGKTELSLSGTNA